MAYTLLGVWQWPELFFGRFERYDVRDPDLAVIAAMAGACDSCVNARRPRSSRGYRSLFRRIASLRS